MDFGWAWKAGFVAVIALVLFSVWYGKRNPPPPEAK
jgi:hypothetical protein